MSYLAFYFLTFISIEDKADLFYSHKLHPTAFNINCRQPEGMWLGGFKTGLTSGIYVSTNVIVLNRKSTTVYLFLLLKCPW